MKENQNTEWKQSWRDDYLRWVCGFANAEGGTLLLGLAGDITPQTTPQTTPQITPEVRLLQALASATPPALPRRILQQALGLSDDEHFRKTFLLPALADGLIEMTLPDKPTSRLQQYRLTDTGRTRLKTQTHRGKRP